MTPGLTPQQIVDRASNRQLSRWQAIGLAILLIALWAIQHFAEMPGKP